MQSTWSASISLAFSGVTKIRVESGVRIASVKPWASQRAARCRSAGVRYTTRLRGPTPYSAICSPIDFRSVDHLTFVLSRNSWMKPLFTALE